MIKVHTSDDYIQCCMFYRAAKDDAETCWLTAPENIWIGFTKICTDSCQSSDLMNVRVYSFKGPGQEMNFDWKI